MRITILTIGSSGNVEPYAALAQGPMAAGHEVTLATHERFQWSTAELGNPIRGLKQGPAFEFPCCCLLEEFLGRIINRTSHGATPRALAPLQRWATD